MQKMASNDEVKEIVNEFQAEPTSAEDKKGSCQRKRVIMSSTQGPGGKINFNERLSAVLVSLRKVSSLSEYLTSL